MYCINEVDELSYVCCLISMYFKFSGKAYIGVRCERAETRFNI